MRNKLLVEAVGTFLLSLPSARRRPAAPKRQQYIIAQAARLSI